MGSQGDCHTVLGDRDSVRPPTWAICTWTLRFSAHFANSQTLNSRSAPFLRMIRGIWVYLENDRLCLAPLAHRLHGDRVAVLGAVDGRRRPRPRPALVLEMVHQGSGSAPGDLGALHRGRTPRSAVPVRATRTERRGAHRQCQRPRTDRYLLLLGGDDPGLAGRV